MKTTDLTNWNNYKETKEAKKVIRIFEEGSMNSILAAFVKEEAAAQFPAYIHIITNVFENSLIPYDVPIKDLFNYILDRGLTGYIVECKLDFDIFYPENYDFLIPRMIPLSIALYGLDRVEDNDCYIPYLFYRNFKKLKKIAETFGVEMPPLPSREDVKERVLYYLEFCRVWNDFRIENDLTMAEVCAFIYDFAPKYIEESND